MIIRNIILTMFLSTQIVAEESYLLLRDGMNRRAETINVIERGRLGEEDSGAGEYSEAALDNLRNVTLQGFTPLLGGPSTRSTTDCGHTSGNFPDIPPN